jgi:hypothetical protein
MAIRLNWKKVTDVHKHLTDTVKITLDDEITFIIVLQNGTPKKSVVKFKDFLEYLWAISDDNRFNVLSLIATDSEGRILYRHVQTTPNEEVPYGGNDTIVNHWKALTPNERDVYLTMLIAQINAYE